MNESATDELLVMAERDRKMRDDEWAGLAAWDDQLDRQNAMKLQKIILELKSWPSISKVGRQASSAAWLIAQHADHDPTFQQDCLRRMRQTAKGEVDQTEIAYLEDRVRVNTGAPQLYGTQFHGVGAALRPHPIEKPEELDKRRLAMGLKPFAEYKKELEAIESTRVD